LRSPGLICGSSSCAAARPGQKTAPAHKATKNAAIHKLLLRYRIRGNDGERNADFTIAGHVFTRKNAMNINDKAPDFTLQDENGKELVLKDLRGKTVILFFYPRANTPG
jgi:cytochrome oxidase Cu insertion factor (SCO1/SenC/PrrC family)